MRSEGVDMASTQVCTSASVGRASRSVVKTLPGNPQEECIALHPAPRHTLLEECVVSVSLLDFSGCEVRLVAVRARGSQVHHHPPEPPGVVHST
jgi:hypothetical protein